ncbi:hypothetical protein YC2023_030756 [Brassica napus]
MADRRWLLLVPGGSSSRAHSNLHPCRLLLLLCQKCYGGSARTEDAGLDRHR